MNCHHCLYPFDQVYHLCTGYATFDATNYFEPFRFCSLNCALYYIVDSGNNLPDRLKNFFYYYDVDPKKVKQALPRERLNILGGDLSYSEYRKDFICPVIDPSYGYNDDNHQDLWISDGCCK